MAKKALLCMAEMLRQQEDPAARINPVEMDGVGFQVMHGERCISTDKKSIAAKPHIRHRMAMGIEWSAFSVHQQGPRRPIHT